MKVLCVCEHGNNRSVHFASILKRGSDQFDTLACGMAKNSIETLDMLFNWADIIVLTDAALSESIPEKFKDKLKLYNVGPDTYNRPYNPVLYEKIKLMLEKDPL